MISVEYGITTGGEQQAVTNEDGSIELPGGGTITTQNGTTIDVPPGTSISSDGIISFANDGGGTIKNNYGHKYNIPADAEIILDAISPLGYYVSLKNPFSDINEGDWHYDYVMFVYARGLMNGTWAEPMMFSPDMTATRGMVVTILYRMAGSPEADAGLQATGGGFIDVSAGAWYADAVKWAAANGIVSGYGDGRFGPEDDITREDFTVILYNYAAISDIDIREIREYTEFNDDAEISYYAREAIIKSYKAAVLNGKPGNMFAPKDYITRAEAATILKSFIEAIVR